MVTIKNLSLLQRDCDWNQFTFIGDYIIKNLSLLQRDCDTELTEFGS